MPKDVFEASLTERSRAIQVEGMSDAAGDPPVQAAGRERLDPPPRAKPAPTSYAAAVMTALPPGSSKAVALQTLAERQKTGAELRRVAPRSAHGEWRPTLDRRDPVEILIEQGKSRIQELLPLRHARMKTDRFAFMRGSAAVMAADLGTTPSPGIRTQSCGDCHLKNFGVYAAPEGTPVFDINDFDESLPAPFEWDLKRLTASLVVAGQVAELSERDCRDLARAAAKTYHRRIGKLAAMSPLDAWSERIDIADAVADIDDGKLRDKVEKRLTVVLASGAREFDLIDHHDGHWRLREALPLVRRISRRELPARQAFADYARTLQEDRQVLLRRYALHDVAFKTVGVGSVGTFCAIGLLVSADGDPLLLQIKEAQPSVLAPHAGPSAHANHGQRVVLGQRMLQAATDVFLGWTTAPIDNRHFYVRRLKDSRLAGVDSMLAASLPFYAGLCGHALARAHARAGDAGVISGYLGQGSSFDEAITQFAMAYADQTERDWRAFVAAIESGRITAASDEG